MLMDIVYTHCAGLDVHKKTVVAAIIVPAAKGGLDQETRTFGTMTADLLALSDWLMAHEISHVAMESTGEYWKPVYNILETNFEVLLVNAQHVKAVPGRKTDVNDAEWLADLLRHGLLRASFVPPLGQRELRELTRHRSNFIRERATVVNRVQKVLESANLKLGSVASNVVGVSGRAMLEAIIAGQATPAQMAELSKGRMREKREQLAKALEGRVKPHPIRIKLRFRKLKPLGYDRSCDTPSYSKASDDKCSTTLPNIPKGSHHSRGSGRASDALCATPIQTHGGQVRSGARVRLVG
jgi:transposase